MEWKQSWCLIRKRIFVKAPCDDKEAKQGSRLWLSRLFGGCLELLFHESTQEDVGE